MVNNKIENPTISIIVPCYNQAEFLDETLQSVIDQEFQNWECIIVNDGSPDNTEDIAKEWVEKDCRIKYYTKRNTGVSDTRNFGIKHATGEFILPLDADDTIDKSYIKEALIVFEKQPKVKLVYSNIRFFGTVNREKILSAYRYQNMLTENQIFVSAIFRKSDFLKTNGYNLNMADGLEDWDFWLSFLDENDLVIKLDGFYLNYRIKARSRSTEISINKNENLLIQIFKNHTSLFLRFFNPIRDHINADHYKSELDKTLESAEYRIGKILCFPYRILTRVLNRLLR